MNQSKIQNPKSKIIILTFLLGWLIVASQAHAAPVSHPAPSVLKDYILSMTVDEIQIYSYMRVSPELVPEVYRQIDLNGDGSTSESERQNWIKEHLSKISITLDDKPVTLDIEQVPSISKQALLASIDYPIKINYTSKLASPVSGNKHRIRFTYGDNYLPYDEYYLSVAGDVANDSRSISIAQPKYPATYQIVYIMPDMGQPVPKGELAPAPYTVGSTPTPAPAPVAATQGGGAFGWVTAIRDQLRDTLGSWNGEIGSALGLFLFALVLGGLHALTPGHGKAMVAAYLVGSRGRVRDAITLGWVVTVTHTAVVFALGLAIAFISGFIVAPALYPALELIAGLLVVVFGAYLLLTRVRELRARNRPRYLHAANEHKQTQAAASAKQSKSLVQVGAAAHSGSSLPVRVASGTTQNKSGNGHDHEHTNVNGQEHGHTHGSRYHVHVNPNSARPLSRRGLVGLGIAGGLVPCSDAIAILLIAGVGRIWLGMGLVAAFSLGLAVVLIGIGVALVKMKGRVDTKMTSNPFWTYWVPVISACVVTLMGLYIVFSVLGSSWG